MTRPAEGRRALFLDRDGTLIVDVGYPREPSRVEPLPGAFEALAEAARRGFALVVVSNQSGVARGRITREEAQAVQERVEAIFAERGVRFDAVRFCFHGPDEGCPCRKPAPGMLEDAARALGITLGPRGASVMIGDKPSDVRAGRAAGCVTVGFGPPQPWGDDAPDVTCERWSDVAAWLGAR
jgi:histidinol-phosphate phosphatase family protein